MTQAILIVLLALADTTIVSTSVVAVDRARRTLTVAQTDAGGPRRLAVAPSAMGALASLRRGTAVVLTLSGSTVVGIQLAGRPAPAPTSNVPQLPPGSNAPQARPIPQIAPGAPLTPSPGVSPVGVAPTRPAVSPVAVRSPRSPGTPKPVVLPSDPPPTPIPSPAP
jgi:hypothetical protein